MGQTGKTLIGTVGKSAVKEVAQDALVGAASSKAGSLVMNLTGDANLSRLAGLGTGILSGNKTGKALNSIDNAVSSSVKTLNQIDDVADVTKAFDDAADSAKPQKSLKNSGLNSKTTIDYSYKFDRELVNFNDGYEIKSVVDKDLILVQFSSDAPDASLCYWTTIDEANGITTLD